MDKKLDLVLNLSERSKSKSNSET